MKSDAWHGDHRAACRMDGGRSVYTVMSRRWIILCHNVSRLASTRHWHSVRWSLVGLGKVRAVI